MKKVFVVLAITEGGERHLGAFKKKPSRKEIVKQVWEDEGKCEDISFYEETTQITVEECEIE